MSSVKKQKTKFTPRLGLTISLKPIEDFENTQVLETPIKRVASVSNQPIVNNDNNDNKRELIEKIKKWQDEIQVLNKENLNNFISASFTFFQGTKVGDRNDEDKLLATEIKGTIKNFIEKEKMLDSNTDEKILRKYNAIKKGIATRTFGGNKSKKSYKRTTKKHKKSIKNRKISCF